MVVHYFTSHHTIKMVRKITPGFKMENIFKIDNLNIGSLNLQGINNKYKQHASSKI